MPLCEFQKIGRAWPVLHSANRSRLGRSCLTPLLEALAAEDRSALGWPERDCGFLPTLRARSAGFDLAETASVIAAGDGSQHGNTLGLTGFTTFGCIPELLIVKEQLFPSREDKIRAAVDTL